MKKNNDESLNSVDKITELLATGDYKIGEIYFEKHNENTRFVIVEKYPEKYKDESFIEDGISTRTFNVSVELIKTIQYIETTITINKSGEIE